MTDADRGQAAQVHPRRRLEAEWEHEPVPARARKSLASVSLVWLGFPMIFTGVVTGALIVTSLGFRTGVLAIALGNLFLFGYVGALSALGARSGYSFALLARTTFGARGYLLASGLLATIVVGWFAVQTGLVAVTLKSAFSINVLIVTIAAGLLYTALTLLGVRALTVIGAVSAPLFLAFGIYAIVLALGESGAAGILAFEGGELDPTAATLGAAVALTVGLFIDSGTMTPDFTRWAKSRRDAWIAAFTAFPVGNGIAMMFGGVAAAAAANTDLFSLVADQGGVIAAVAVVVVVVNLGSVCAHCLYNASVGWAHFLDRRFRPVALAWGLVGTVIAASGAWSQFTNWLIVLGVIVPPIGAVILTDHLLLRRRESEQSRFSLTGLPPYRWAAVGAWGVGSGAALATNFAAPQLSVVVVGFVVAGIAFYPLASILPSPSRGRASFADEGGGGST